MAAAEYYNARPSASAQPSFLAPPAQPQRASSHSGFVYPQSKLRPSSSPQHKPQHPPPPPYQQPLDQQKPSVHFTPSPSPAPLAPQRDAYSYPQRPSPPSWNQLYPPPQNLAPPNFHPQPGPYVPPQYAPQSQHLQPYVNQNPSEWSLGSGYASDPERHRQRKKHGHHHQRERGHSTGASRSTNTDGFIGAAGGGLIGDMIFPGLGTVGGALAGWLGGKDYGNHRKWREQKRSKEQREWEKVYGSRDREHSERSKSHERRRSHE